MIEALDTNLAYVREHTCLLTRSIEWHDNNRRHRGTLRGPELLAAEGRLAISQTMQPLSTHFHREYTVFSREMIRRLQQLIYSSIAAGFILGSWDNSVCIGPTPAS